MTTTDKTKSIEEMAKEATDAVFKEKEFNFKDDKTGETYTKKESELDEEHLEMLVGHMFSTYNSMPAIVQNTFFHDIVAKMAEFAKKNKGLMKKSKGFKTGK